MEDAFLAIVMVYNVRHLSGLEIPLSETERKHLILTGKNGSGKTSLLEALKSCIINESRSTSSVWISTNLTLGLNASWDDSDFIFYYSGAKRSSDFKKPKGPSKINYKQNYKIDEDAGVEFLQHMVNLTFDRLMAKDENDQVTAMEIDKWFNNFERALRDIFEEESLKLEFDKRDYNFNIISQGKEKFDFNTLSQGYSAILNVVTNLMMRMEGKGAKIYDVQGIALIDEIETHLHIALQKKILPFLTKLFPRIQFIVTTHSPFVLNSIDNAVIYDLESQTLIPNGLAGYSSEAIVESYFDQHKYSQWLMAKVARYEELMMKGKGNLSDVEEDELDKLERLFKGLPTFKANEFEAKIQQVKLAAKTG